LNSCSTICNSTPRLEIRQDGKISFPTGFIFQIFFTKFLESLYTLFNGQSFTGVTKQHIVGESQTIGDYP
jgi:hypothetical protein